MNLRTFIERPVFSAVISITIVILGIIGLFTLPVEQYPDIAPPTIMVTGPLCRRGLCSPLRR